MAKSRPGGGGEEGGRGARARHLFASAQLGSKKEKMEQKGIFISAGLLLVVGRRGGPATCVLVTQQQLLGIRRGTNRNSPGVGGPLGPGGISIDR